MSCNGCRVLRKGCSETCILRPCLQWIQSPESQGHATVFVAKFFGRAGLLSFISAVPELHRPALFQSLLFEACGRTVNPVNGAVGMLSTGNWHVCQAAVETVLRGGTLRPISDLIESPPLLSSDESSEISPDMWRIQRRRGENRRFSTSRTKLYATEREESPVNPKRLKSGSDLDLHSNHGGLALTAPAVAAPFLFPPPSFCKAVKSDLPGSPSEESVTTSWWENGNSGGDDKYRKKQERKLLNLFA